jgi:hypothetical protein
MTEAEWRESVDPEAMLETLRGRRLDRKLRLFMVACCRRVWHDFAISEEDWGRQEAVEVAERYADGLADDEELSDAFGDLTDGSPHRGGDCCSNAAVGEFDEPDAAVEWSIIAVQEAAHRALAEDYDRSKEIKEAERAAQAELLRCIVGNPSRPVTFAAAWRTETVTSLAQAVDETRDLPSGTFDPVRMAVLADALEETGCADETILSHLRSPGPHVRGCWVMDLILGKS